MKKVIQTIRSLTILIVLSLMASCCNETAKKEKAASTDIVTIPIEEIDPKMEWFQEAKLGIFIHWGIYAVDGTAESWAFFNEDVTYDEYMSQSEGFTASKYDPETWVKLYDPKQLHLDANH